MGVKLVVVHQSDFHKLLEVRDTGLNNPIITLRIEPQDVVRLVSAYKAVKYEKAQEERFVASCGGDFVEFDFLRADDKGTVHFAGRIVELQPDNGDDPWGYNWTTGIYPQMVNMYYFNAEECIEVQLLQTKRPLKLT